MFHGDVEQCPWITYIDYSEDFIIVYFFRGHEHIDKLYLDNNIAGGD